MADKHYTEESDAHLVNALGPDPIEEARKLHHLATADPEPERDGTLTGAAHEAKYNLEREESTAEYWRGVGVHPYENRALKPGDEGYVAPGDDVDAGKPETATGKAAPEKATAARASDKS